MELYGFMGRAVLTTFKAAGNDHVTALMLHQWRVTQKPLDLAGQVA